MKDFIILSQGNGLFYKDIFPLTKERKIWLGRSKKMCGPPLYFYVPSKTFDAEKGSANRVEGDTCYIGVPMCCWIATVGEYVPDELKLSTPPKTM